MPKVAPWMAESRREGAFRRKTSEFRSAITPGGPHAPETNRYHLYVSWACPWAHRTLLTRTLLGLEAAITVDVVDWRMQPDGSWIFNPDEPGATADTLHGATSLQDVYHAADPDFAGIGTVPVLWDKKSETIVNNESRDIVRMLDTALAPSLATGRTLLPDGMATEVDRMIDANYESVNNGVYKCGFARSQEAYDEAWPVLFSRLDELDEHLSDRNWLCGDGNDGRGELTEADICLWPTLVRFDPVYHTHFKCDRKLIAQYPNLTAYVRRVYQLPGVAATTNMHHIRNHYYWSHTSLNPHRIVPVGPDTNAWLNTNPLENSST